MQRCDNRKENELRRWSFQPDFQSHPLASVLTCCGGTRVICAVSLENNVPPWMKAQGVPGGWITAEYQMLPSATNTRGEREVMKGKLSGRSAEIQRLVGRALRAVVDLEKLPGVTLHIDCDVIDADGGTRCASITGASLALQMAAKRLLANGTLAEDPIRERVAAVSVGLLRGEVLLDLCYTEDHDAEVDMNVVMTSGGRFVEIQGSGEEATFSDGELAAMLASARQGLKQIFACQEEVLATIK
ncbi:MAG: ribonuclease PH [Victivallales bacterium]|nr:ribonuclease PH [Victivallales bacterium]